jgi:restriction system protein
MTVRDAAIQVLRATSKPLRADEITEKMISGGLWETTGKTPAATVAAALYSDIKKNGEDSPFRLVAPQTFSLKADYVPGEQRKGVPGSTTPTRRIRSADKTYSFTDSAEKVLEEFGKKQPLHYRQITEKALEMGWLVTDGKTPEATMYAQIITEIKQYQRDSLAFPAGWGKALPSRSSSTTRKCSERSTSSSSRWSGARSKS